MSEHIKGMISFILITAVMACIIYAVVVKLGHGGETHVHVNDALQGVTQR